MHRLHSTTRHFSQAAARLSMTLGFACILLGALYLANAQSDADPEPLRRRDTMVRGSFQPGTAYTDRFSHTEPQLAIRPRPRMTGRALTPAEALMQLEQIRNERLRLQEMQREETAYRAPAPMPPQATPMFSLPGAGE